MAESQLSAVVTDCREALERCVSIELPQSQVWARTKLIDFNMWADGLGVFAGSRNSLQTRLEGFAEVRTMIISMVRTITQILDIGMLPGDAGEHDPGFEDERTSSSAATSDETLTDVEDAGLTPRSDDSVDTHSLPLDVQEDHTSIILVDARKDFDEIFEQLVHLGVIIRRSGTSSRLLQADTTFDSARSANLQALRAHLECLLRISLWRKARRLNQESARRFSSTQDVLHEILQVELGAEHQSLIIANLRRRHRFLFARERANVLSQYPEKDEIRALTPQEASAGVNRPLHELPSKRSTTSVLSQSQTFASAIDRSAFKLPSTRPEETQAAKSLFTSTFTSVGATLTYPKPPPICQDDDQKVFKCPCCHQTLPISLGKRANILEWKNHLKKNLMPYHCPLTTCARSLCFYTDNSEWRKHFVEQHQTITAYRCPACNDNNEYGTEQQFQEHVIEKHHDSVPEQYLQTMSTMGARSAVLGLSDCPVCAETTTDGGSPAFMEHVAQCLHDFSLRSLPWNDMIANDGLPRSEGTELTHDSRMLTWLNSLPQPDNVPESIRPLPSIPEDNVGNLPEPLPTRTYFGDDDNSFVAVGSSRVSDCISLLSAVHESSAVGNTVTKTSTPAVEDLAGQDTPLKEVSDHVPVTESDIENASSLGYSDQDHALSSKRSRPHNVLEDDEDGASIKKKASNTPGLKDEAYSERTMCCVVCGCHGRDKYISYLLKGIKHNHNAFICPNCYEKLDRGGEEEHKKAGCERHCVNRSCKPAAARDAQTIISLRHPLIRDRCPARPVREDQWSYVYALMNPDSQNVPDTKYSEGELNPHGSGRSQAPKRSQTSSSRSRNDSGPNAPKHVKLSTPILTYDQVLPSDGRLEASEEGLDAVLDDKFD